MQKIKRLKPSWQFYLGLILSTTLLWPLMVAPFFASHGTANLVRIADMTQCLKDLQLPCRWSYFSGGGFGYPLFNYLPPLPYYLGGVVNLLTSNLFFSAKVLYSLSIWGLFLSSYLLSRKFWGEVGGVVSGLVLTFAPFIALNLYVQADLGELWGIALLPAVLWSLINLYQKRTLKNVLIFGILLSALILSSSLAWLFLPLILLVILGLIFKNICLNGYRPTRFLRLIILGLGLSLALSSFYLWPLLIELKLVHFSSPVFGYFSYTEHFKGLTKLFLNFNWGYGFSTRGLPGGPPDGLSYQVGLVQMGCLLLSLIVGLLLFKKNRSQAWLVFGVCLLIFLNVFLINPASVWVWQLIGPLKYLNYPWRLLSLVVIAVAFISGSIPYFWSRYQNWVLVLVSLGLLVFNWPYFKPLSYLKSSSDLISGWQVLSMDVPFAFLPLPASYPAPQPALASFETITGNLQISNFVKTSHQIRFRAEAGGYSIVRLSEYYFPDWKVWVDNKEEQIDTRNPLGLITFIIGKGSHQVNLQLENTRVREISNFLSLVGFLMAISLGSLQIPLVRRRVIYYLKGLNR